jgi:type I restriction enzyme S subunit
MERYELPERWEWRKLPELANLKNGGTPSKANAGYWNGGTIPFVTAADLTELYVMNGRSHLTEKGLMSGKTVVCEPGDVLIGTRTRVGNCSIARVRMGASQDITRTKLDGTCLPEYLCYYLRNIANEVAFFSQGSSIQGITRKFLNGLQIPLPSLAEQRRIVARIEELTRRIEETRLLRKTAVEEAERYIPAAIASVFGDGQNRGWVTKKIGAICEKPQYGYTESATYEPVGPKFLRITDIQNGKVDWGNVPYCRCDDVDKYSLETGDMVFARTGATTGKSFLVTDPPEAVFASYLIRLRVGPSILPEFLYWYFQSSTYWASVSSGIEDGNRPNMNGTKLANLEVSFAEDKNEQRHIVEYLDNLQYKAEALKQLQVETEAELAVFTPALLAKAFRGEL